MRKAKLEKIVQAVRAAASGNEGRYHRSGHSGLAGLRPYAGRDAVGPQPARSDRGAHQGARSRRDDPLGCTGRSRGRDHEPGGAVMKGWIVRPQRRFHDGIKVISLEYGLTPTVIATVNDELAEAPVHASVIAAAPEMLEALKTLHSNFGGRSHEGLDCRFDRESRREDRMKTCSCGRSFVSVPQTAQYFSDDGLAGWYWNCSCRSTMYLPGLVWRIS
jgi:hypothetical protein